MSNIKIHPLSEKPDSRDTCIAWAYGEWGCHKYPDMRKSESWFVQNAPETGKVTLTWVAFVGDKIAGTATLDYEDHDDHKDLTPWLANVFVHPFFRGQGVATQLVNHVKEQAKEIGYPYLYLSTPDAQALYEKLGWEKIGPVRDTMGLRDHNILMKIEL